MDLHLHSRYSLDSDMDMEIAVCRCVSYGYAAVSFTDHVDLDYPGYGNQFNVDFDDYFNKVNLLQKKYSAINILRGVEAGVTADNLENVKRYLSKYRFDYIILSEHIVLGEDPYSKPDIYYKHEKKVLYKLYLEDIYKNMSIYRDFDTLGHYDYITRYAIYEDPDISYVDYKNEFDNIFSYIIKNDKALEINTRTYDEKRYGIRNFDFSILKAYKSMGGKYICLGSDAHDENSIGYKFDLFKNLIKEAGFDQLTYFKDRKPILVKI